MEVPEVLSHTGNWNCTDCSRTSSLSGEPLVYSSQSSPHFIYEQILTWTSSSLSLRTWNQINDTHTQKTPNTTQKTKKQPNPKKPANLQARFSPGELPKKFLCSDSTGMCFCIELFSPGWNNKQSIVMNMPFTTFVNTQMFLSKVLHISLSNILLIYLDYSELATLLRQCKFSGKRFHLSAGSP